MVLKFYINRIESTYRKSEYAKNIVSTGVWWVQRSFLLCIPSRKVHLEKQPGERNTEIIECSYPM